jgi:4-oxalocrotonate tautomerase
MPHVIIKMYTGRSDAQKQALTEAIVDDLVKIAGCRQRSVSVAIEEIDPQDWVEKVYKPDIIGNSNHLVKKPGYNPFEQSGA